ncbi:complex I subunit 5 family protein [Gilvimarinus sp. F26214L]|uniref:complex I subunit 5 family protein n=1 Tax=Gilvimarinus sp. DZF01 TaxID=3461371 RepID=UPI00404673C2
MIESLILIFIPGVPVLAAALLLLGPRIIPWLWLSGLPAVFVALFAPTAWQFEYLWQGAHWQAAQTPERTWLAFSALLWMAAAVFAIRSTAADGHRIRFWLCWQLALAGNLLLIIAQDALSFYVGFSVMSLAAYPLILHYERPEARRAGRLYLQLAILGEMALLGVLAMRAHAAGGATAFSVWQSIPVDISTTLLLLFAFGIKIGFWPLHFWLPLAHPAAPSPASAVLSGAMIEAGIFGLWRTLPGADSLLQESAGWLAALALITAFYGVALGLLTDRAKAVLAFSSVSQMGYLLLIVALMWHYPEQGPGLALLLALFAAHHGAAKGALFLAAGLPRLHTAHWILLAVPALAISGLPLTSGAAAKGELEHLLAQSPFALAEGLLPFASTGTALLLFRALWLLRREKQGGDEPSMMLVLPWALLCLTPLGLPWLPPFQSMLIPTLEAGKIWELLWPLGLAVVVVALALRRGWQRPAGYNWTTPALNLSLRLKRLTQNPPVPYFRRRPDWHWWRDQERLWNHFINRRDIVSASLWLLCFVLFLGFVW